MSSTLSTHDLKSSTNENGELIVRLGDQIVLRRYTFDTKSDWPAIPDGWVNDWQERDESSALDIGVFVNRRVVYDPIRIETIGVYGDDLNEKWCPVYQPSCPCQEEDEDGQTRLQTCLSLKSDWQTADRNPTTGMEYWYRPKQS